MKRLCCIFLILFSGIAVAGSEKTYGDVKCVFVRAYDGDTITVNIPGWPDVIGHEISVRVYGIDTAEKKGTSGSEHRKSLIAKQITEAMCACASVLELKNIKRDKYFRILADVCADGVSVADVMIEMGLAKPYFGGKKYGFANYIN